ncbi:hypothetical protein EYF80_054687 [Liparis tanakae]|uniref:Uncharacterized protein n=1 Tax=Liparis tanakae TaxID=230148 RepID=A0A4Z2F3S6_9TELE|nr:hypothetical protein EYF80_054687 [Liparis tanakae]
MSMMASSSVPGGERSDTDFSYKRRKHSRMSSMSISEREIMILIRELSAVPRPWNMNETRSV